MQRARTTVLFFLACLMASPMLAQTTIGGGSCNSATANGTYAVSITGRQVTASGSFTNVLQANGSATFDGQSKVTIALTEDTGSAAAAPGAWSGTYSVQANCAATVTIATGNSATLNLVFYGSGNNFLISGTDATYYYSGSGDLQPTGCSASKLSGVYTMTGTGYSLSSAVVNGAMAITGLLQFDGQSVVTANLTMVGSTSSTTLAGAYSVSSNCLGSATLTGTSGGSYVMAFSIYTNTTAYSSDLYVDLAQSSKFLISGGAHAIYGQPSASAMLAPGTGSAAGVVAKGDAIASRRVWA